MEEDLFIRVNNGGLIAEGTAAKPITFTRVGDNGPLWRQILFEANVAPVSRLVHVNISYANSPAGSVDIRDDTLSLDHVSIKNNTAGAGVYSWAPLIEVKNSTIEFNKVGVHFHAGGNGQLRNNLIQGNIDAGVLVTNNSKNNCIDAIGNDWGNAGGPKDSSSALDNCNQMKSNNGGGNSVSDDILYEPWLSSGSLTDHTSISPDPYWVVSNGIDQAVLTITLRNSNGQPVPGKQIELATTRGFIQQPGEPTDADGVTTAVITSTVVGDAIITARNVTNNKPLSGIASVNFWQGQGDAGPLINPSGVPYDSPHILIDGKPFQEGLPMTFRVPMQNSSQDPVQVTVKYSVSGLGLGLKFTPVDTIQTTLQPGESWDALGGWLPTVTGHKCVQATITSDVSLSLLGINLTDQENEFTTQKNTDISSNTSDPDPEPESDPPPPKRRCTDPPEDSDLAPTELGEDEQENLEKVVEHEQNQASNWS